MAQGLYVATIQVVLNAQSAAEASDGLHEVLEIASDLIVDWGYLKVGGQYLFPNLQPFNDIYQEGDLFI